MRPNAPPAAPHAPTPPPVPGESPAGRPSTHTPPGRPERYAPAPRRFHCARLLAALAALALLAAACSTTGNDDDDARISTADHTSGAEASAEATSGAAEPAIEQGPGETTCGTTESSDVCRTMEHPAGSGETRNFFVHDPPDRQPGSPVLVVLHGIGGTAEGVQAFAGARELADRNGWLLLIPNGRRLVNVQFWEAWWDCCTDPETGSLLEGLDSDGWILRLIQLAADEYGADPAKSILMGHSNGALMIHRIACTLETPVAALVTFSGTIPNPEAEACQPKNPIALMHVHGDADPTVPYAGGTTLESLLTVVATELVGAFGLTGDMATYQEQVRADVQFQGAEATVERWAGVNGCGGVGETTEPFDIQTADSRSRPEEGPVRQAVLTPRTGCSKPTQLVRVIGGIHTPMYDFEALHPLVLDFLGRAGI